MGLLRLVNELSPAELGAGAGLTAPEELIALQGITAYRAGSDAMLGTLDDVAFPSLAALDAIPLVGPVQFQKLLALRVAQIRIRGDVFGDFAQVFCRLLDGCCLLSGLRRQIRLWVWHEQQERQQRH